MRERARVARSPTGTWKMQDAKAQFSRVVKLAREVGPQRVTYRGKQAVVVVSAVDYERVAPAESERPSLFSLLQSSPLSRLKLKPARVRMRVRKPQL